MCTQGHLWLVFTVILTTLNNTRQCFYQSKTVDTFLPINVLTSCKVWQCLSALDRPWEVNSSKKVRKLKFDWRFLSCYQLIFLAFGIIGKPCYSSFQWCAICYDYAIWGCAAHLNMGVGEFQNFFWGVYINILTDSDPCSTCTCSRRVKNR